MPNNINFYERITLAVTLIGFFITGSMLDSLGLFYTDIADAGDSVSGLKIHPYSIILLVSLFSVIFIGHAKLFVLYLRSHRAMMLAVMSLFAVSFVGFLNTGGKGIGFFVDTIWAAIFIDFFFEQSSKRAIIKLKPLILAFIMLETVLALIEAAFSFNLIPIQITYGSYFRATALHGHPLNNALIVVAVYLTSMYFFPNRIAFGIYAAGIFSLIALGARSGLVLFTIFGFVLLFRNTKNSKILRLNLIIFGPMSIILFSLIAVYFGFAERLVAESYFDDSAYSRLDALDLFDSMTFPEFMWGLDAVGKVDIMGIHGLDIIENFWISYIVSFGFVLGSLIILTLGCIFLHLIRIASNVSITDRMLPIVAFLLVASTNNSLVTKTSAMMLFVVVYRIWLNDTRKNNSTTAFSKYEI